MDMREQTRVLNQISISRVGSYLGCKIPDRGSICCPFPDHKDSNPSFSVFEEGKKWKCFGCGRSGGTIDFVKEYLGTTFIDAKMWLSDVSGNSAEDLRSHDHVHQKAKRLSPPSIDKEAAFLPDPQILAEIYTSLELSPSVRSYMASRGFNNEVISRSGVREFLLTRDSVNSLLKRFGFQRLYQTGIFTKQSRQSNYRFAFPSGSVLFPFFREGKIVNFQARLLGNEQKYGKWRNLVSVARSIYNYDDLLDTSKQSICICEGVTDTLSAIQLGMPAIGILGVSTDFTEEEFSLLQGRAVYLMTDWDEAGEQKAKDLGLLLSERGIMSIRKSAPSQAATDLNEYLVEICK